MFKAREIYEIAVSTPNAQDGVILALIFGGLSPSGDCRELIHLKVKHVDFENNVINVYGDMLDVVNPKPRQVPISKHTKQLIENVLEQKVRLVENDYVLRGVRNDAQVNWEEIHQGIARVAKKVGYEYLNATTVSYSGQLYLAKELLDSGVELDNAVSMVLQRFGIDDSAVRFSLKQRVMMDLAGKEIPLSQEYFWTQEWQGKMEESQKDIEEGRYKRFDNVGDLVRDLDSDEDDNENI
ncbi:site-specific integrase [Bacillus cereus group sp. Bc200]|uniref:site-specific integrase n=1 Tax=Bacillus cereus group sp. Bc200 TaxID=3018112 RepID=UPI0022DFBDD1|nr:site-specific integrase [Bacillus cereus group sp. Bc200]MDA2261052.1 site-specific integrase [Bacillus cereus group sp. Bc200]